jgi:hypothetical protein
MTHSCAVRIAGRDVTTHVSIVTDPDYLTEPLIKSEEFLLNERGGGNWLWPCEYVEEVADRPKDAVPHYLPGQSPNVGEFAKKHGIPLEATRGGAATMYPEYAETLKKLTASPAGGERPPSTGSGRPEPAEGREARED